MTDLFRDIARQLDVPYYEFEPDASDAELTHEEWVETDTILGLMNITRQIDALGLEDGE